MNVKELYTKGREVGITASIETAKYLSGYNIHKEHVKQRQKIIETTENNIGKRVLKLSLNYTGEALREVVRYTPLVIEAWILYKHTTADLPLSTWIFTSAPIRGMEAEIIIGCEKISENKKNKKEIEDLEIKLKKESEILTKELEDIVKETNDRVDRTVAMVEDFKNYVAQRNNNPGQTPTK